MRPTILVLVVLAIFFVALALAPAANARPQGWYLGLGGGWTTLGSVNYALAAPAGPQQSKVNFGDSGEFGMAAGYRLPVPLRLEADIGFADYGAKFSRPHGLPASSLGGGMSTVSFVTSAVYDIPLSPHFSLSFGLGLGAADANPSMQDLNGANIHDSKTVMTWSLISGLTTTLSDDLELQLDYRYQEIDNSSHSFFSGRSSAANLGVKHINSALISLRWYVTSALPAPRHKLGTSALSHYIPEPSGPPMLSQPSLLNQRFAQFVNFDSSKPGETVKGDDDSPVFAASEAWGLCNRRSAIEPWS